MILNKTKLGLDVFDRTFGGIYFGRAAAVSGPRNGDKTLVAAQFANKVFQTGERVCVIGDHSLDDFFLDLRSLGADPNAVIATGQMAVLSCAGIATQGGDTPYRPSGECIEDLDAALHELSELATERGFPFFVFNTVLPWIAAAPVAEGVLRTDRFVTALERVGATSLLLLPRPVSPAAKKLRTALEMRCAAAIRMSADESGARTMRVVRYGKDSAVALPATYQLAAVPGKGLVSAEAAAQADSRHLDSFAASRRRPPRSGKSADGEKRFRPLVAPGAMVFTASPEPPAAQAPARQQDAAELGPAAGMPPAEKAGPGKRYRSLVSQSVYTNMDIREPQNPISAPAAQPAAAAPPARPAPGVKSRHRFSAVIE